MRLLAATLGVPRNGFESSPPPPPNNLRCHCVKLHSSSKLCMGVLQQQARPSGKDPERHPYLSS